MKAAFIGVDPSVLQVDTTFNYESSGYKLSACLYLNPATNKGEVGQLSFMGDEGGEAYQFAFTTFRSICLRDPPVIIVDKVGIFKRNKLYREETKNIRRVESINDDITFQTNNTKGMT